jgi:hypothetical protein
MNPDEFAYCLACWMSPGVIARAAEDWSNQPEGHEMIRLKFESKSLTSAEDAGFNWFLQQFLDNVIIPEELIRFTQGMYSSHVSSQAADWMRNFKFTGDIEFNPDIRPQVLDHKVLVVITAPLFEISVIRSPISMLNELLSAKAFYWKQIAGIKRPDQIHYEASGEWLFEQWIDLHVARKCGFPKIGQAGVIPPITYFENVRGQISIVGELPKDDAELSLLKFAACLHPRSFSEGFDLYHALKLKSNGRI